MVKVAGKYYHLPCCKCVICGTAFVDGKFRNNGVRGGLVCDDCGPTGIGARECIGIAQGIFSEHFQGFLWFSEASKCAITVSKWVKTPCFGILSAPGATLNPTPLSLPLRVTTTAAAAASTQIQLEQVSVRKWGVTSVVAGMDVDMGVGAFVGFGIGMGSV